MFKMEEFIEENLTEGYLNRAFFKNQVKIFALNYLNRGQIEQECFDRITKFVEENEPYPEEEEDEEPPKE
ncbi:hypothetical protein KV134_08700 [Tetragenococcus halophilus]|nr:hypothetical protein KV134_08700 [Tetragenococcus halophilus]